MVWKEQRRAERNSFRNERRRKGIKEWKTLGWNVAGCIVRQPRLMRMETRRAREKGVGNEWKGYMDFGLEEATTLRMQQGEGETDKVF